jgi:hypothetical protein
VKIKADDIDGKLRGCSVDGISMVIYLDLIFNSNDKLLLCVLFVHSGTSE